MPFVALGIAAAVAQVEPETDPHPVPAPGRAAEESEVELRLPPSAMVVRVEMAAGTRVIAVAMKELGSGLAGAVSRVHNPNRRPLIVYRQEERFDLGPQRTS